MSLKVTELPDGTAAYITNDGDMVDQIAYAHYGTHQLTAEAIYAANQDLSRQEIVLPAGVRIILRRFTPPAPAGQIQLWS